MGTESPAGLRSILHEALANIELGEAAVLLDYPAYPNIGDHMIWAAEVDYLAERRCRVVYQSSAEQFQQARLAQVPEEIPVLMSGGGNLGDLWPRHQLFRETVIRKCGRRRIIVLPQTIYFRDEANLDRAARVFNNHPDITLFVRDEVSLAIAREHFHKCRSLLAPDMALQLGGMLELELMPPLQDRGLYLCRKDQEQPAGVGLADVGLEDFDMDDWISCRRSWNGIYWELGGGNRVMRTAFRYCDEMTRRPAERYREYQSRRAWREHLRESGAWTRRLLHAAVYQFNSYPVIVTNRLHGHILATLVGKPHVFLPNTYHKNRAFYDTWSGRLPNCVFAWDASWIRPGLEKLAANTVA